MEQVLAQLTGATAEVLGHPQVWLGGGDAVSVERVLAARTALAMVVEELLFQG